MRNIINIKGNNQIFPYLIEYSKGRSKTDGEDITWSVSNDTIHLLQEQIKCYRVKNNWVSVDSLTTHNTYIPNLVKTSSIKIYLPSHSAATYINAIKYSVTATTYINGMKVDLGTFVFKPNDAIAISSGTIKKGNNEYHEFVEFDIIDPFYLLYSDDWINFRHNVCGEPKNINNTCSALHISLFVIDEYENGYMIKDEWIGGGTNFTIADESDFLSLHLSDCLDPFGFKLKLSMNDEYNWFLSYLLETYGLSVSQNDIKYEFVIKNKDSIIIGPTVGYAGIEDFGKVVQNINWSSICDDPGMQTMFSTWDTFEEGWNLVASLVIHNKDTEIFNVVSNELPITQELFSKFVGDGSEKIIDLSDMNVVKYNVVNKIENKIIQIERPNASKSNIVQPVFYRVKDLETLTLHPVVTENISINLDDYKSKVEKFTLLIDGCKFEQIGSNKYGILFKITANTLPATSISGTYYILNENDELVTTGKYNCIR